MGGGGPVEVPDDASPPRVGPRLLGGRWWEERRGGGETRPGGGEGGREGEVVSRGDEFYG